MKLMLFLSHNGILSRRKAFEAIKNGAVAVNGRLNLEPSTDIDPLKDQVHYHGRLVNDKIFEYIILNKPDGYVTTCEKQFGQMTVMELLPKELKHLRPVGRLDRDTEGLILFTNDGELANQMAHPSFNVDKTYFVRVQGQLTPEAVKSLQEGVILDDRKTAPALVQVFKADAHESEYQITIHEGRKHQVRLMGDAVGFPVVHLKRLRQGPLVLGSLPSGQYRRLTEEEAAQVRNIKRLANSYSRNAHKKEFQPRVDERKLQGRRGRGEVNKEERLRQNTREREEERRQVLRDDRRGPVRGKHRPDYVSRDKQRSSERPVEGRTEGRRPPRPEYSSRDGHRSSPRPAQGRSDERSPAALKPLFSSNSEKRRYSSTREWHSDSDVHAPKKETPKQRPPRGPQR